jgi:ubiquinone/menaquinone biosynthesis C-methylase UbiE
LESKDVNFSYEAIELNFGIFPEDLVLDVGCGPGLPKKNLHHSSFPRANVLVDSNLELVKVYGKSGIEGYRGKKFIVADIEALPFRDRTFHFVWCAHILEHVLDPEKACKELMRIGLRGRIKTPSKFKEIFFPLNYHLWMVGGFADTLVFERSYNFLQTSDWKLAVQGVREWKESHQDVLPLRIREMIFDWTDSFRVEVYR